MGILVECPDCENRFRVHNGQGLAHCYDCNNRFNAATNPALERSLDDPVGGDGAWQ